MLARIAVLVGLVAGSARPVLAGEKVKIGVIPAAMDANTDGAVPALIDDYILGAVQNAADAEVIGQEDLNTLIGFEKQKELLGCDDVTCMARFGGALGVDSVVVVKVARVGDEWVVTSKLINIRAAKVDVRRNDFVRGDVKALLEAITGIIGRLFHPGREPLQVPETKLVPPDAQPPPPSPTATMQPDPELGRGSRAAGIVLMVAGTVLTVTATLVTLAGTEPDSVVCSSREQPCASMWGFAAMVPGIILQGVGSGIYMNGRAKAATGDERASGRHDLRWLGWLAGSLAMAAPIIAMVTTLGDNRVGALEWILVGGSSGVATGVFLVTAASGALDSVIPGVGRQPMARLLWVRDRDRVRPALGFAFDF